MAIELTKTTLPAKRRQGMTLGELAQFVQQAHRHDIDPDTPITGVRVTMRARLVSLTVVRDGQGDA